MIRRTVVPRRWRYHPYHTIFSFWLIALLIWGAPCACVLHCLRLHPHPAGVQHPAASGHNHAALHHSRATSALVAPAPTHTSDHHARVASHASAPHADHGPAHHAAAQASALSRGGVVSNPPHHALAELTACAMLHDAPSALTVGILLPLALIPLLRLQQTPFVSASTFLRYMVHPPPHRPPLSTP